MGVYETMGDYAHRVMDEDQTQYYALFWDLPKNKKMMRDCRLCHYSPPKRQSMAVASAPPTYKGLYLLIEQVVTGQGELQEVLVYTPFSTTVLYAWNDHLRSYTDPPPHKMQNWFYL